MMEFSYQNVPRLGNVIVSRHAQARLQKEKISEEVFKKILLHPTRPDRPDGQDILWRERDGIRLVILTRPTPDGGAGLIKTIYRIKAKATIHR